MLQKWNTLLICFSALFLITFAIPNNAAANGTYVKTFPLNNSAENEILLDNGMVVSINLIDDIEMTVEISRNENDLFNEQFEFISLEEITYLVHDSNEYLILPYRYDGSGGTSFFEILKLHSDSVEQIYVSSQYEKANITIDSNVITATGAVYGQNDPMSSPSKKIVTTYEISNDKVIKTNENIVNNKTYIQPENNSKSSDFYIMSEGSYNPPADEISRILTEKAIEYNIPPEIIKAIAAAESNWLQFREYDHPNGKWKAGDPVVGEDKRGIGIMQITRYSAEEVANDANEDIVRLKNDIEYNIEEGLKILKNKWNWGGSYTPVINDDDPFVLDHWYFAILAYNGMSYVNDPNHPNAKDEVYQDRVYRHLEIYGDIKLTPFPIEELDFYYDEPGTKYDHVIRFKNKMHYDLPYLNRKSHHGFVLENWLQPMENLNLRSEPSTTKKDETVIRKLSAGEIIEVTGDLVFDTNIDKHYVWYPVKTQNGETGFVASSYVEQVKKEVEVIEFAGENRYKTAIKVSSNGWDTSETIILANGFATPDALTGSVLAKKWDAPLLLTDKNALGTDVATEINRLQPKKIYILGGYGVISKELEDQLIAEGNDKGFTVTRIGGSNRMKTAALIANEVASSKKEIFVAAGSDRSGKATPDALSVAPYAGFKQIPIFLTKSDALSSYISDYITNNQITKVTIIGGEGAITTEVADELKQLGTEVVRIAGKTRFDTSLAIAKTLNFKPTQLFFARGDDFVDALSASPLAAREFKPIILVKQDKLPEEVKQYIKDLIYLPKVYFVGGHGAINLETRNLIKEMLLNKFPVPQSEEDTQ
jgi:putative cell wall-binding protein